MNLVAIDTEFNSENKILSLGIYSEKIQLEDYFNNKVDKYTYEIHCLPGFFLNDNGKKYSSYDYSFIFDYDFVTGFDISQDLSALKIKKINSLYISNKIIDLKIIINSLGVQYSLSDLYEGLSITDNNSGLKHSSFFDAKMTYLSLVKIFEFSNFSDFNDFLIECAKLTSAHYLNLEWEKEDIIYRYFSFSLEILKSNNINSNKKDNIRHFLRGNYVYTFNDNCCIYRFPEKYLKKKITYSEKCDFIFPDIGVKFNNELVGGF